MKPLKDKTKTKLLKQMMQDLKSILSVADDGAKHAFEHLASGSPNEALNSLLQIEPQLYDAKKLFLLATYVKGLGKYEQ